MANISKFTLYGKNDPQIQEALQPRLDLRKWSDLEAEEKKTALNFLVNEGWVRSGTGEILQTIKYLNHEYLRRCPGKNLHEISPGSSGVSKMGAALSDFQQIFLHEKTDEMVLLMLSRLAQCHIDKYKYERAESAKGKKERNEYIADAFRGFDRFAKSLNHMFEQFSVNVRLTRNSLIPVQDEKITEEIYEPTLKILSDPKWKTVSDDLAQMFDDYREGNHPEVITKAHSAVHRFLQILVGEEGKSGKGEFGTLFKAAKKEGLIPVDRFSEPIIKVFQSFFPSERANKSSAKPAKKDATPSDALLMMNVVMVFLQHCLQHNK